MQNGSVTPRRLRQIVESAQNQAVSDPPAQAKAFQIGHFLGLWQGNMHQPSRYPEIVQVYVVGFEEEAQVDLVHCYSEAMSPAHQ